MHTSTPSRIKHATILVVDDGVREQRLLRMNLEPLGYRLLIAEDATTALEMLEEKPPDLILLEVHLADGDGFELCQQIRQVSTVPVIVLSVLRQVADKIRALQLGADDFVSKPFDPDELDARIKAVLRRVEGKMAPQQQHFTNGPLTIDFSQHRVWVDGQEVNLSATEYRLLEYLAENAGRTLVMDTLLAKVWGSHYAGGYSQVHLYISRLRRKLGDSSKQPRFIVTRSGAGYMMPKEANNVSIAMHPEYAAA